MMTIGDFARCRRDAGHRVNPGPASTPGWRSLYHVRCAAVCSDGAMPVVVDAQIDMMPRTT
jgi:hypothetical protein